MPGSFFTHERSRNRHRWVGAQGGTRKYQDGQAPGGAASHRHTGGACAEGNGGGDRIKELAAHFKWKGPVGIGFPGVVQSGVIRTSANLHKDFIDLDAEAFFSKATGMRVSLVNDADAAGAAEARFGQGKGRKGTVLLLTFGTGVGSALFVDGVLYPNSELGHLKFHGKSAEKTVAGSVKDRKKLSYKKWAHEVSDYLNQLETILCPELIIVGGGISADHDKWFKHLKIRTPIVPAAFLNEAGIVGAALSAAK